MTLLVPMLANGRLRSQGNIPVWFLPCQMHHLVLHCIPAVTAWLGRHTHHRQVIPRASGCPSQWRRRVRTRIVWAAPPRVVMRTRGKEKGHHTGRMSRQTQMACTRWGHSLPRTGRIQWAWVALVVILRSCLLRMSHLLHPFRSSTKTMMTVPQMPLLPQYHSAEPSALMMRNLPFCWHTQRDWGCSRLGTARWYSQLCYSTPEAPGFPHHTRSHTHICLCLDEMTTTNVIYHKLI